MSSTDFKNLLHTVGLRRGDRVVVHSSFRKLRPVVDTPQQALQTLLDVLGPQGDLVLPSFNYELPAPDAVFDPAQTPARTGALVEAGRAHPDAIRSLHPTHSVTVIGPGASALTQGHLDCRTMGVGSPLDRLAHEGGKVLLLGLGQTANSTIHVAEEHAKLPKTPDPRGKAKLRLPDGRVIEHTLDASTSCSAAFAAAELALRQARCIADVKIAQGCHIQLMRGIDVIEHVSAMVRREPMTLLCTNPDCTPCRETRRRVGEQGGT